MDGLHAVYTERGIMATQLARGLTWKQLNTKKTPQWAGGGGVAGTSEIMLITLDKIYLIKS